MANDLIAWLFGQYTHQQFTQLNNAITTLTQKVDNMAAVQIDQTDLDNLATQLGDIATNLATEIQSLQQQLPAADLSGINTQVQALQNLEVPAAAAAPQTPPAS